MKIINLKYSKINKNLYLAPLYKAYLLCLQK